MFRTMECTFDDLTVWRTALPHVEHALLPPASDRPNPRLGHGLLFTSVFSPGCVYAMDAATGEIQWRRELPYFGGDSVELAGDLLFAKTSQNLYALEPASGSVRWEFCPYGSEGEMLYSLPRLYGKRLIIRDRQGWLHCLDADSGQTIWKRQTSDAQVNATAIVARGLAITANNARSRLALPRRLPCFAAHLGARWKAGPVSAESPRNRCLYWKAAVWLAKCAVLSTPVP